MPSPNAVVSSVIRLPGLDGDNHVGRQEVAVSGRNGRRCIDDPKDILRREIEWTHKKRLPVAPVLVCGARMPDEGALPPDMKFLHRLQALPPRLD